jgi:hypothetical protein
MRVTSCIAILAGALWLVSLSCANDSTINAVSRVGTLADDDLDEASGIVASRKYPGIFWTHNDGDDGVLFAVKRDGSAAASFKLEPKVQDWEDIAADEKGRLFVADTGNNSAERSAVNIIEIPEPDPAAGKRKLEALHRWRVSFPQRAFDIEALIVRQGNGYVISKYQDGRKAELYRFEMGDKRRVMLEKLTTLPTDHAVTAADLSADGKRLAVLAERALYVFEVDGTIESAGQVQPAHYPIPAIKAEGCCFVPDGVLLVAESREVLLVKLPPAPTQPSPTQPSP